MSKDTLNELLKRAAARNDIADLGLCYNNHHQLWGLKVNSQPAETWRLTPLAAVRAALRKVK